LHSLLLRNQQALKESFGLSNDNKYGK